MLAMDEIVTSLCRGMNVTQAPCAATMSAGRFAHLRNSKTALPVRQELRRQQFLERQKEKRYDGFLHARGLATGVFPKETKQKRKSNDGKELQKDGSDVETSMDAENDTEDDTDSEVTRPRKPSRSYRNQLMQSEWLVEVPSDLTQYVIMPCPKGKRGLLVASKGVTKLYARNGFNFTTFTSNLPGGSSSSSRQSNWKPNEFTILDVVFSDAFKTCFVLDLIYWRSRPYYDSATSFRFFWLKTQFEECANELSSVERKVKLELVQFYEWEPQRIQSLLCSDQPPFSPPAEIDGVLFYHSEGHYIPGICPLVGWLKPYMIPEVLNLEVHPRLLLERPPEYTSLKDKMDTKEKKREQACASKSAATDSMGTSSVN
ncbi:snurportin-1-like [Tropilaelaps mercedesae]|uniref:Snurportin-1 n=1 Tax=Tropilaelaps mercedesae TaxID=418985 RepID=A0A1V9WYK1_9ACAR|nr:snurportin-1-like [Tropilaelaps mercedesae]